MSINIKSQKNLVERNKKLLTVAIPTFNRAVHLKACLERFGLEFDALSLEKKNLFSMYISNNASTDETSDVIGEFVTKYPGLVFVSNNLENIGGEKNVVKCYMAAESSYVWIFGDDDAIIPGGLSVILDVVIKNELDMLFIPCCSYADINSDVSNIDKLKIEIITDPLIFSRRVNVNLTFISAMIVRSRIIGESEIVNLNDSNLPQLGWVFSLLKNGNKFAILKNKLVAAKAANTGGYGLTKVFGKNLQILTTSLLSDRPKIARALQNAVIIDFFPPHILALRQGKSDFDLETDMTVELNRLFNKNWRYFVFIAPILYLPIHMSRLYNFPMRIFRRAFRFILI